MVLAWGSGTPSMEKGNKAFSFHKKEYLRIRIIDLMIEKVILHKKESKKSYTLAAGKCDWFHAGCN